MTILNKPIYLTPSSLARSGDSSAFREDRKRFYRKIIAQLRRRPRVHGYTSPKTTSKFSSIHGIGLFATSTIDKGEVVAAWGGKVTTKAEIEALPPEIGFHYALQLRPGFYLAERSIKELDSADFINHSCQSNCRIEGIFTMVAKRTIHQDEELTADFSNGKTTGESFHCRCGSKRCSGKVYFD